MTKRSGKKGGDEAIVLALAAGGSIPYAARSAGVSETTVRRRLSDPALRARIGAMRSELIAAAVGRLATLGRKAADKLNELLDDPDAKIRLGASRSVLQYMLQGHEHELLAAQVAELQRQIEIATAGGGEP
jgi:hypothetical protein